MVSNSQLLGIKSKIASDYLEYRTPHKTVRRDPHQIVAQHMAAVRHKAATHIGVMAHLLQFGLPLLQ